MIDIVLNGQRFNTYKSLEINSSLTQFVRTFSLGITVENFNPLPVKSNQQIEFKLDNTTLFTGWVDPLNIRYTSSSHDVTISGRSYTSDFQDSTVGSSANTLASLPLEQIILKMLAALGINNVQVINKAGNLEVFNKNEVVRSRPTDTCYSVAERYAKKRQVLLYTDANSNIVIFRPEEQAESATLEISQSAFDNDYIKQVDFTYDPQNRFHTYRFRNSESPTAKTNRSGNSNLQKFAGVFKTITDEDVRPFRVKDVVFDAVHNQKYAKQMMQWAHAFDKADSFNYRATVAGFNPPSSATPWEVGTYIRVIDEFAGFDELMLLGDISYRFTLEGGSESLLTFKPPGAYELAPEPDNIAQGKAKKKRKKRKRSFIEYGIPSDILEVFDRIIEDRDT